MQRKPRASLRRPAHRLASLALAAVVCLSAAVAPATGQAGGGELERIEALIQGGRFADAEGALRALPAATARSDFLLGFTLIRRYRFAEAEEALQRAVASQPENHASLHALAKARLEQSRNLAAIEALDRAIALAPRPDYLFAKAMCALNVGDLDTAERALVRCLEGDPKHANALYKLGRILVDRGDWQAALDPLRRCLAVRPAHLEARFLLGLAESGAGDPAGARAAFETVLEAVPGHVGALYNLGRVLLTLGRREQGLERLELFRVASRRQDEIDFLTRAVKKNPENPAPRLELAHLLLAAGRTEEALTELAAARQIDPGEAQTYRLMAEALRRLGRDRDARQAAEFAAALAGGQR